MADQRYGPETSQEERGMHRMQIVYAGKMRQRQVYMEELKEYRKKRDKRIFNIVKTKVGPTWYHALSVPQRNALDTLAFCIHQDLMEGIPVRTSKIIRDLGITPRPNNVDLMTSLYLAHEDPKLMLAELFAIMYGHPIDGKRASYNLNSKLLLSSILYLGLNNLIALLKERFRPDQPEKPPPSKPKPKPEPPLESPYLQKMIAALYEPPQRKRSKPSPLPNLDDLDEPYEEEPPAPKPPPPPPPPPPPKKRLPRSYCDKLAGIVNMDPHTSVTTLTMKAVTRTSSRRVRGGNMCVTEVKKTYGISLSNQKKSSRRKRLKAPNTGMWNSQYMINGVYEILGKTVFVLGNVSILPPVGELIHGGYRYLGGECINIHLGFRARSPPPPPDPCDCVKKWHDRVFQYVKDTKCYCEHYFDYGNEGTFPPEELPFFRKPTKTSPFQFNYETIYDLDEKRLHVEKEFKKIWDTDSMLRVDDGTVKDTKDKKKKKKRPSTTCLGENPQPEDYLKCALRLMRRVNVAARLPDIHLAPELKEWMRRRIYGPYKYSQKADMLWKSSVYWQMFQMMASKGYGHISPSRDPKYSGHTTWVHKQDLNDKFRKFAYDYKLALFRSLAKVNNLMWATMYQAEFPDKKFREIYFSYLFARVDDMQLMHPYNTRESMDRQLIMSRGRYCCIPAGIEPPE